MCHFPVNENYSHHPSHHHNLGHTWLPTLDFCCTQDGQKRTSDRHMLFLHFECISCWRVPEQVVDLLNSHWFRVCKCVSIKLGLCGGRFNKRLCSAMVQPCSLKGWSQFSLVRWFRFKLSALNTSCTWSKALWIAHQPLCSKLPTLGRAAKDC